MKVVDKVLSETIKIGDLNNLTEGQLLKILGVSWIEYSNVLNCIQGKVWVAYKEKPCKSNISLSNAVILKLLKSNVSIHNVQKVHTLSLHI